MNPIAGRALIIFDKDGTLIDFDAMWGGWIEELARRLAAGSRLSVGPALYALLGYDADSRRTLPGSHLAVTPMAGLRQLTVEVMRSLGQAPEAAESAVRAAWFVPDPVALARPFTDLAALFGELRRRGHRLAVATSDDRAPTEATLAALGVAGLLDGLYCADDGLPVKPAPDIVLAACRALGIEPTQAAMVGDSVADLQMARAAGALAVGVTSGTSPASVLAPHADIVLAGIIDLLGPPANSR